MIKRWLRRKQEFEARRRFGQGACRQLLWCNWGKGLLEVCRAIRNSVSALSDSDLQEPPISKEIVSRLVLLPASLATASSSHVAASFASLVAVKTMPYWQPLVSLLACLHSIIVPPSFLNIQRKPTFQNTSSASTRANYLLLERA